MASGAVTLDTVMLKVETEAGKAGHNIDSLSAKLANLKSSLAGGFNNLNKLAAGLNELRTSTKGLDKAVNNLNKLGEITDALKELSDIKAPSGLKAAITRLEDLSKLSNKLSTVATNVKSISKIVTPMQSLSNIQTPSGLNSTVKSLEKLTAIRGQIDSTVKTMANIPQMVAPMQSLGDVGNMKGFANMVTNLSKLPDVMKQFDAEALENFKRVCDELSSSLTPLAEKMQSVADGYSAFSKVQNTFGKSASTVTKSGSRMANIFGTIARWSIKAGKSVLNFRRGLKDTFDKKVVSQMESMRSKIKQITLSLLGTRTIFTMTRKAISEYQAFDTTLQKFSTNIWRAFGAQLAPAVEYVMELFKQFVRVVYSFVYAITGIDLIARANAKAMASWAKDSAKALGNLQKFDDLNVVEFDKGDDDNELISMDKIDLSPIQKIIDWVKQMKAEIQAALDTGKWYNVGVVFAEGINEGITYILANIDTIKNKLRDVADDFTDALNGAIATVNWENVGKLLTEALTLVPNLIKDLFAGIEWEDVGTGITDFFKGFNLAEKITSKTNMWVEIVTGLQTALLTADWTLIGTRLSEVLVAWSAKVPTILKSIDFRELGKKLGEALSQVEWGTIFKNIFSGIGEIFSGIIEGLTGIFEGAFDINLNVDDVTKLVLGIVALIGAIVLLVKHESKTKKAGDTISKSVNSIGSAFSGLLKSLGTATIIISVLGGLALVLNSLSSFMSSFAETNMSATDGLILIGGAIAVIAAGVWALSTAMKGMSLDDTLAMLTMFAGLAAVFYTLSTIFTSIASLGDNASMALAGLSIVLLSVTALVLAMAAAALLLVGTGGTGLLALAAVVLSIVAIMITLAATLPTILDACSKFINSIAPFVIKLLTTIGNIITEIIYALGTVLPPIINSVGTLFTSIFNGVSNVFTSLGNAWATVFNSIGNIIKQIGNTISQILNSAASLVERVLNAILKFINKLGPAINNFVDDAIRAVTKLINFIVSAVEYLINSAIIKPINSLINKINNNAIAEKLGWQLNTVGKVSIERFAPALSTGTNEIPYEGLYHLHPGEAVVPKKYNPALGGGSNEETNAKLDTLITLMNNMNTTTVVNIGNRKVYEGQAKYNKQQQNKYGTINLY